MRDFPLIRNRENVKINYENKCTKLFVDQIALEDLVEFQNGTCDIIQGMYWVDDTKIASIRKHTIRNTIQIAFDQRLHYKKIGSLLQKAFKLVMNSAYEKIIMKDIKISNEYIQNNLVLECFDTKYNLIDGVCEVNSEQSSI